MKQMIWPISQQTDTFQTSKRLIGRMSPSSLTVLLPPDRHAVEFDYISYLFNIRNQKLNESDVMKDGEWERASYRSLVQLLRACTIPFGRDEGLQVVISDAITGYGCAEIEKLKFEVYFVYLFVCLISEDYITDSEEIKPSSFHLIHEIFANVGLLWVLTSNLNQHCYSWEKTDQPHKKTNQSPPSSLKSYSFAKKLSQNLQNTALTNKTTTEKINTEKQEVSSIHLLKAHFMLLAPKETLRISFLGQKARGDGSGAESNMFY